MRTGHRLLTITALAFASAHSLAHHGVAPHYDVTKPVKIEGTIAKFEFINPHSFVEIRVADASGSEQVWRCEFPSRSVLERDGVTVDTFKPGEHIVMEGVAARHNPTGCAFRVAHLADGRVLESSALFGPTLATAGEAPTGTTSIVGTWTMKHFEVPKYDDDLTEAGKRAQAAFDPIKDDPAIYCDPASPVRFWVNVNEPFEIRRDGDAVVIDNAFMDSRRLVHLREPSALEDVASSTMGYSVGHFDGDALLVTTDHFKAATLEPRWGVLHSDKLKLAEKLAVSPATGELEITWTIDDPVFFKRQVTRTEYYVRSARKLEPYNCKPGYQQ